MNQNFKVVFSKARNALMVVNEATASVQHKGAKTVIAAAVASLLAGTALAAEWKDAPAAGQDTLSITEKHAPGDKDQSLQSLDQAKKNNVYTLSFDSKAEGSADDGFFSAREGSHVFQKGQSLWVTGSSSETSKLPNSYGFYANGATVTNEGAVYVTSRENAKSWSQKGMMADKGGTVLNQGVIVAKKANGMMVGSTLGNDRKGSTIENGLSGDITVIDTGAGMVLSSANQSKAINRGVINVGAPSSEASAFTHGVQIKDSNSNTFVNDGTINAQKGTTAINVDVTPDHKAAGNQVLLNDGSTVNGRIRVGKRVENTEIQVSEKAAVNGNLELSGTGTALKGSEAGSAINGNLQILAGDTSVSNNLTVQNVAVSADAALKTEERSLLTLKGLTLAAQGKEDKAAGKATFNGQVIVKGDSVNSGAIAGNGSLQIAGGHFQNAGSIGDKSPSFNAIDVAEGASLTNTGLVYVKNLTVAGTVTSGMFVSAEKGQDFKNHVKFDSLTLERAGKFVIVNKDLKTEKGLVFQDGTINLNGGQFYLGDAVYDGAVTVGGGEKAAHVEVGDGAYRYAAIETKKNTSIQQTGGELTVGQLTVGGNGSAEFKGGKTVVDGLDASSGSVKIDGGNVTVSKTLKTQKEKFQIADSGVLHVAGSALGFKTAEGKLSYEKAEDFNAIQNAGTIYVTGVTGAMTRDALTQALNSIQAANQGKTGLVDLGAVTVSDLKVENGGIDYKTVAGMNGVALDQLKNAVVTGVKDTLSGSYGSTKLAANETALKVGSTLQLNGSGNLVTTSDGKLAGVTMAADKRLITSGSNAVIGAVNSTGSKVGALYVKSGSLNIQGDAYAKEVAVAEGAALAMPSSGKTAYSLKADTLKVDGSLKTDGKVSLGSGNVLGQAYIGELESTGNIQVGALDKPAKGATLVVSKLTSGKIFADPAWVNGTLATPDASKVIVNDVAAGAAVEAGQASLVGVGAGASLKGMVSAFDSTGYTLGLTDDDHPSRVKSVLYVNAASKNSHGQPIYTVVDGKLRASGASETQVGDNNVQVDAGSMLLVDANGVDRTGKKAVFAKKVTLVDESVTYVANARIGDKIKLSSDSVEKTNPLVDMDGGRLLKGAINDGVLSVALTQDPNELAVLSQLSGYDSIVGMYTRGADMSSSSARFNRWLTSTSNGLGSNANVVKVGNDVAAIGATAGMASVAMDALSAFSDTVAARTNILAARGEGLNVWADVNGGRYEAKKLMNGAGYSSDIYAGTLGVDATVPCGAVLGLALTIGTADTKSANTTAKTSMDSDLFGISLYTSKTFSDMWNVAADFGYMQSSNDVKVNAYGLGGFSADTDALTFGLRGEALAKAGSLNIVPHIGFRWTRLSVDSFESGYTTDINDMNVLQMPVGVTFAGEFDMNGMKVAPSFDLSAVPSFGDKNAAMKLGIRGSAASDDLAVRVIDANPIQAVLGVNATTGAWNFGLNYKLGAGSSERLNNSFNLKARYAF